MFKRRSAHGISASRQPLTISAPSNFVRVAGMGSMAEAPPVGAANSITADPTFHKQTEDIGDDAVGEPLVHDFDQVQRDHASDIYESPRTPPPASTASTSIDFQPLKSHPVTSSSDEDTAPPPPDFTRRGIHIPTRTSSSNKTPTKRQSVRSTSNPMPRSTPGTPRSYSRTASYSESVLSYETTASSVVTQTLVPLQEKGPADASDRLSPLLEDDPRSFDLVAPTTESSKGGYSLEERSEQLLSKEHLEVIFNDAPTLLRFTTFLSAARPKSVPVLIYYLDATKALRAINYANAVAEALEPLEGHEFTAHPARSTVNAILEDKARQAFDVLVREDLPAFISHVFIQQVSTSIQKRITGNLPPMLREASEGLAEVFCLTDPSRSDNPIIFASEEFHRTTQYGVSHAIGRNCRFLQGPRTNPNSIVRIRDAVKEGKELNELFLNYRRDGSPFMNLLMMAPLMDSRGTLRYFIGAQVDISGLVRDATDLEAFQHMLARQNGTEPPEVPKDEFQELSEMFNNAEIETVRRYGGMMHREHSDDRDDSSSHHRPRLLIKDPSSGDEIEKASPVSSTPEGRLSGVYKHYLLVRPFPSLRILFTSPSLRVPGILQSKFLDRIGGSERVRASVAEALADGTRGVTAKVRWLSSAAAHINSDHVEEGRPRWIHCTPLLGASGAVGVWMVVLVDDEKGLAPVRRFRPAPPVSPDINRQRRSISPTPGASGVDSSGDEADFQSPRRAQRSSYSYAANPKVEAIRRPQSAMSSMTHQRAARSGSPKTDSSINSFALG